MQRKSGPSLLAVPEGDTRERMICPDCGFVQYDNPKVVVGAVVRSGVKVLMCRRAIPPRKGFWTLPAGYLELNETAIEGAQREAWEEARARIAIDALIAVYNIPRISQIQLIWRASLVGTEFEPGPESLEVRLFDWDEIPSGELAFPSVRWALAHAAEIGDRVDFAARGNPSGELGDY